MHELGWDLQHTAEVEFEEAPAGEQERGASPPNSCITLEITAPSEGKAEFWNCYSLTPPQVKIRTNNVTLKHTQKIVSCLFC